MELTKQFDEIIENLDFPSDGYMSDWLKALMLAAYNLGRESKPEDYSKSEVSTLIKQVLEDAAERATANSTYDAFPEVDKESITSIDISKYLTK